MSCADHVMRLTIGQLLLAFGVLAATGCSSRSAGVGSAAIGDPCKSLSACVKGAVCVDSVCRQVCSAADQCPAGQGCAAGVCGACGADVDCAGVGVCSASACVARGTAETCASDRECAQGACNTSVGACCLATCTLSEPSGLITSLLAPYDVRVTWQDNSDTETGYLVERCAGATCSVAGAVFTSVATLPPDATEFSDLGLAAETNYFYRVSLAFGPTLIAGSVSGIATAPAAPAQVQVLEAERAPRLLSVRWLDQSQAETAYRVSYVRHCPSCGSETPIVVLLAANEVSAVLGTLSPSTTYEISVEALKGSVASAPVSVLATTTAALDPALVWGAAPSLAEVSGACRLSVSGSVTLDPAATLVTTLGSVQGATVISSTAGVVADLVDFTPSVRPVTWTATDSLFGTSTIAKDVTVAMGASAWRPAPPNLPPPEAKLGRDAMAGRQPLLAPLSPPCQVGMGRRAALVAGSDHVCALTASGTVKCWGNNWCGQLGLGDTIDRHAPGAALALDTSVAAIAAGYGHTCVLTTSGAVKCSGWNPYGQLGLGDTATRVAPVEVTALGTSIVAVAIGSASVHSCAITASGTIKCWGYNQQGELGLGDTVIRRVPVDVSALLGTSIVAAATGGLHTCALSAAGAVKCWGYNALGELGLGDTAMRLTPTDVPGLGASIVALGVGDNHTCVLSAAGAVKCWGSNSYGQLGLGDTSNRLVAADVTALGTSIVAIAAGSDHTCAQTMSGAVKCWGGNFAGQLALGDTLTRLTPADVPVLGTSTVALTTGLRQSCAVSAGGSVKCWGLNSYGQLGLGDTVNRPTPVDTSVQDGAVLTRSVLVISP